MHLTFAHYRNRFSMFRTYYALAKGIVQPDVLTLAVIEVADPPSLEQEERLIAEEALAQYGITLRDIEAWGGAVLPRMRVGALHGPHRGPELRRRVRRGDPQPPVAAAHRGARHAFPAARRGGAGALRAPRHPPRPDREGRPAGGGRGRAGL